MFNDLMLRMEEQLAKGSNFAVAQVIDRIAPTSGKVGDKALILDTGELIGWIGGGCVRGIVIKEALEVIKTKRFRRIRISPEGGMRETPNFKEYVMSCQSRGTVEVLIEPVIPQPEIIIVGKSNISRKLTAVAHAADMRVTVMSRDADLQMFPEAHDIREEVDFGGFKNLSNTYIIVTTQGEDDENSVLKAMQTSARFVGFVASKKKSEDIKAFLSGQGVSEERISDLRSPVGLDINAKLASEVAISILADIVDHFREGDLSKAPDSKSSSSCCSSSSSSSSATQNPKEKKSEPTPEEIKFAEEYYINPVCNVPVSRTSPKHVLEYKGEKVYFCCDGCKVSFEKNPAQYIK
jgi:xanthine dehydrogenase accessory factor